MPIAVVGMLDEREEALRIIKERLESRNHRVILMDISIGTGAAIPSLKADVTCQDLIALAENTGRGTNGEAATDRERVTARVSEGLANHVAALHEAGQIQGIIAIGGMTGTLIALKAMSALPFGFPKLLISSAAAMPAHAQQLAEYFSMKDITVMHTVVDTVGMNEMVRMLAVNGANAISGMVEGRTLSARPPKQSIAITEFGFCDQGAHFIRKALEPEYEIVSFHATGLGDRALVDLVRQRLFAAVIDLVPGTFSELLLGGNRPSGADRLDLAKDLAIPYIFCTGGFDLISCGPIDRRGKADPLWVTRKLAERKLHIQDPLRVQARMDPEESEEVALAVAEKLNGYQCKARVRVVIPRKGFSSLSVERGPLHDPAADEAFVNALEKHLSPEIKMVKVESDINSREFAKVAVEALSEAREACSVNVHGTGIDATDNFST